MARLTKIVERLPFPIGGAIIRHDFGASSWEGYVKEASVYAYIDKRHPKLTIDFLIGLDWLTDNDLVYQPDRQQPSELGYINNAPKIVEVLTTRLPHLKAKFHTMGGKGRNLWVRPLFEYGTVERLFLATLPEHIDKLRRLTTVAKRYWRIID